jgi:hypothetical protein
LIPADYLPCTTLINRTITLDGLGEIPLHPLDITADPLDHPNAANCLGIIQAADSTLENPSSDIGDMILGALFLRNTYTVMAYEILDPSGAFVNGTDTDDPTPLADRRSTPGWGFSA